MRHYSALGLTRGASADEVKRAYRRLALECHPDKGGDAEAFRTVSEAFEVLRDPDRRAAYDMMGDVDVQRSVAGPSPEEIFRAAFGDQLFTGEFASLFQQAIQRQTAARPQLQLASSPAKLDPATFAELVASLKAELFADDIDVPACAIQWRPAEVRAYVECGGGSWRPLRPWTAELETFGSEAPVVPLSLWRHPMSASLPEARAATMLSMLEDGDDAAIASIAHQLARDGVVALPLGLEADLLAQARAEAARAAGHMEPALLPSTERPRGDHSVRLSRLSAAATRGEGAPNHVLEGLHQALGAVGVELTPLLGAEEVLQGLHLTERSDLFVGRLPRGQALAAHFDSACTARGAPLERKLSLTLHLGEEVSATVPGTPTGAESSAESGAELLYDELARRWRSLTPSPGTLVISLADRVLHKATPAAADRLAVAVYLLGGYAKRAPPPPAAAPPPPAAPSPPHARPSLPRGPSWRPDIRDDYHAAAATGAPWQSERRADPIGVAPAGPTRHPQPAAAAESSDSDDEEGAMDELG